jgi:hypothetical protein
MVAPERARPFFLAEIQPQIGVQTMGLKTAEYEQLVSHISTVSDEALATNTREALREALEEISDLTDADTSLVFNEDGTVEVEQEEEAEDADDIDADDIEDE